VPRDQLVAASIPARPTNLINQLNGVFTIFAERRLASLTSCVITRKYGLIYA
jgi:hypothetical protein